MQRRVIRIRDVHWFVSIFFSRITESSQQNTDTMNNRIQSKKKKKKNSFVWTKWLGSKKRSPKGPLLSFQNWKQEIYNSVSYSLLDSLCKRPFDIVSNLTVSGKLEARKRAFKSGGNKIVSLSLSNKSLRQKKGGLGKRKIKFKKKLGGYLKRGNNFPARKALLEKGQQFLQNVENRSFLIFL